MDLRALAEGSNLSRTQLLLWAGYRRYQGLPVNTVPFTFEFEGPLDRLAFDRAFELLVERHEALRSVFDDAGGVPERRVLDELPKALEMVDLSGGADPAAELASWLEKRHEVALDLAQLPFHSALLKLAADRHVWYLCQHHLVTDGLSMGLIYQRLAELYSDQLEGATRPATESSSLSDLYRERLQRVGSERFRRDEAFWATKLADQPETIGLYGDDSGRRSPRERRLSRSLDAGTTARLKEVATRPEFQTLHLEQSLSTIFTGLVLACLYRMSGQSRMSLAVPLHSRDSRAARRIVGLIQETFPLQVSIEARESLASLVRKAGRETWQALRHAASGTPVGGHGFDMIVNYLPVRFADLAGLPTRARWLHNGYGDGNRALFLHVYDFHGAGRLTFDLDCNEAACDIDRQERFADHLLNVVEQFVADPDCRLDEVELMSVAERHGVVVDFNRTPADLPAALTVSGWFEQQAARFADSEAVVFGERSITYAELDRRSARIAGRLRALGVRGGAPVAVRADRSIELMIALLAILKAGGAYLPLDPSFPVERLTFMLEDSGAKVLLTARPYSADPIAAGSLGDDVVEIDLEELAMDRGDDPVSSGQNAGAGVGSAKGTAPKTGNGPGDGPEPADAAYVIYTSGSTGRPKGVVMSQGALANLTWWQVHHGSRLERPRTLQFTPLSFDVSLQETFSTWCSGGTLVLLTEETRRDPVGTLELLIRHRVERLFAIYTPLRRLAETACRTGLVPGCLREVTAVGEQLQITPAVRDFFDRLPDCTFYNQYGPSETHNVTAYPMPRRSEIGDGQEWPLLPTIGMPISNTQIYILDSNLLPVPVGVTGEIHIGGSQVALGYIGRPALTAERFVPDPFGDEVGARLYRTGDLARYASSGEIEFLGRLDHQVKVRGYRIEPGEVESALLRHAGVREAVVVARAERGEDKRLVGYVVPASAVDEAELSASLRSHLADALPEYMVPTAFVVLERLPQTANGKLDRAALPAPSGMRPELAAGFAAPSGGVEQRIAAVWCEVLRLKRVGRHDNFFDLGGNSLLLLEVHARLPRGESPPDLPMPDLPVPGLPVPDQPVSDVAAGDLPVGDLQVADLFRLPTVADLAAHLEGRERWSTAKVSSRASRQKDAQARRRQQRPPPLERR